MRNRLLLPLLLSLFISCVPQEKLARKIVRKAHPTPVLLLNAQKHFFSCYDKRGLVPVDTILVLNPEECNLLNLLTDSIYNVSYFGNLVSHLEMYPGVKVYMGDNVDDFLRIEPNGFVITLAQAEFEEFWSTWLDYAEFDSGVYEQKLDLLNFSVHNWFEISGSGVNEYPMQVAYSKFTTYDRIRGGFRQNYFSEEVYYQHSRKDIDFDELNRLFRYSAMKNASYIFNHILNLKLEQKMQSDYRKDWYLGYSLTSRRISRLMYDKFIIQ